MTPTLINDILNNIITLNAETLDTFLDETKVAYKELAKAKDVDNLKVLKNRLENLLQNGQKRLSRREKKEFKRIDDMIDDIDDIIHKIEEENKVEIQLVDVVENFRKKYKAVNELPEKKKKSHVLVAMRKSDISYEEEMLMLQIELTKLQRYIQESGRKVLIIFEGRDAAGKWGNIKRFMESLNPRTAKVVALQKPTDIERGQWYFQRYIEHLPNAWEMTFFDRSWYNRAWVEPVMGFVNKSDYETFLQDTPTFEKLLVRSGIKIIKFYFSVSKDEQALRFEERRTNPLKQFKLSPIDQFSQKLWDRYTVAEYQNFLHTHTTYAPWIIVNSDDKEASRINAIKYLLSQFNYPGKVKSWLLKIDRDIVESVKDRMKTLERELDKSIELFE
jgi:polyphosphate kinase